MNKIKSLPKILSNFIAINHLNHRLVANNDIMRGCNSQQLIRFLSTTEETIEKNAIKDDLKSDSSKSGFNRERTLVVTPEESIEYLKSESYRQTYGHHKVWHLFRRNFKGPHSPFRPRTQCIVEGMVWTSNPCPVCRDEYLVLHYSNMDLINQFINPQTGYVYENTILCLCSQQYDRLLVAINLAKNYGLLTFELPLRTYDYKDYYKDFKTNANCNQHKH